MPGCFPGYNSAIFSTLRQRFVSSYLTADPRSLALGRIALALVLLFDLAKRVPDLVTLFSNHGLLPNHTLLWRPAFRWVFSFFYMASSPGEVAWCFVICALAYLALLVGYRTRLAHLASLLCVLSLHGRVLFVQNGGDVVLGELCLWTLFLPTGRRFSIDSLRARLAAYRERDATETTSRPAPDTSKVVSLAVLGVIAQLGLIYALNAIHKHGVTWREGSVVHYVLHQDRIVTTLGLWVRERLTPGMSQLLTWPALAMEFALALVVLSPIAIRGARRAAIVLVVALHAGFALFLNLGVFVPAMIAFAPNLIPGADWDALARWQRSRGPRRLVIFDGSCGVCFEIVRILARLDTLGRLSFVASEDRARVPADLDPELLQSTVVVYDEASGKRWFRADAVAEIFATLPFTRPLAWLLRAPLLRAIAAHAYDAFAIRRSSVSEALGLAVCGIPASARPAGGDSGASPIPLRAFLGRLSGRARELGVAIVLYLMVGQALAENTDLGKWRRMVQPRFAQAAVCYLQFWQGWSMFAPEAPVHDMNMYVDALTIDGRHVDPWSEIATPRYPRPGPTIPPRLDHNAWLCDYLARLPWSPEYHPAFIEWVERYPARTGKPLDRIVSFEAFVVEDDSPPPGASEPTGTRARSFLKHAAATR
jgi:predicted DCC family thiol-disulfide oxidoreductase YuxK